VNEIQAEATDGFVSLQLCTKYKQMQQMVLCRFSCVQNISRCNRWFCVASDVYETISRGNRWLCVTSAVYEKTSMRYKGSCNFSCDT